MKKYRITLACLLAAFSCCAQDAWNITVDSVQEKGYYGVTVANGMLGLVSSPKPLQVSKVVLGGVYDLYDRGRVNNFLPGINMLDVEMKLNNEQVKLSNISNYTQTLCMRKGIFQVSFDFKNIAHVEYSVLALRHLPYCCMMDIVVTPKSDISLDVANVHTIPAAFRNPEDYINERTNKAVYYQVMTSLADSPTGKHKLGASSAFIFDWKNPVPHVVHRTSRGIGVHTMEFSDLLHAGVPYRFAVVGTYLSSQTHPDVRNEVDRLTSYVVLEGFDRLYNRHLAAWDDLWQSDIEIEGDAQSQQDVHSMLYHLYAFNCAGSGLSSSPMGLSGAGYNGHVFWDTETWMFPTLLLMQPAIAKSMLDYRFNRLNAAKHNAFMHGYDGAMFPWESADVGQEETQVSNMYGPFEHHITADVANAFWQYYLVTQDVEWLRMKGYPVLSATADFWISRVEKRDDGTYGIYNVIGADEWGQNVDGGKNVDNNAYTNGAAKVNLEAACAAAKVLGINENPKWREVASKMYFRIMENGVTAEHDTYNAQIIKQADVDLLAYPLGVISDPAQIRRNIDYYTKMVPEKGTPAMTQAVWAILYARLGEKDSAWHYFKDAYEPNLNPPFRVMAEFKRGTNPYFATGAGGVLQTVLIGFGGLEISPKGGVKQGKTSLPEQWKSLKIKGVGIEKKNYIIK